MITTESKRGIFALMVAHCAGMLDLVALPIWVGTLISEFRFAPQQAGGLVTLFLIGASLSSIVLAPRFQTKLAKPIAVAGFTAAALAFLLSSQSASFGILAALHVIGGIAAGAALSFTHGTIGHAANPHRAFALVGLAIGVFGIVFLGGTPSIVAQYGGSALFIVFASVMAAAAFFGFFFFPRATRNNANNEQDQGAPLTRAVWLSIVAIALLAMTQAMTLSFYERIGMARGFGREGVTLALVLYGIVTLFPAPLAALLERRVPAGIVICTVPILQALFAMIITHTTQYAMFAFAGPMMAFTIIFTHTYAFGLLARLDRSGRAVAATPAMLMVGAAIAPFLSGTLVQFVGFEAIGYAAMVLVTIELLLFNEVRKAARNLRPMVGRASAMTA